MLWFKMPKNLEEYGIEKKYAPLVCEILYFSNSKTGRTSYNARSLMTKYFINRYAFDKLIVSLTTANILQKGKKKGEYYHNLNWDNEQSMSKQSAINEQSMSNQSATLTIDKIRIDKNRYNTPENLPSVSDYPRPSDSKASIKNNKTKEIIDYLNLKSNKQYKHTTSKTIKLIDTRLKENFSIQDFKTVVDTKCAEWKHDATMNKFIRPETLFGNKFESYLNESTPKEINAESDANEIYTEKFLEGIEASSVALESKPSRLADLLARNRSLEN